MIYCFECYCFSPPREVIKIYLLFAIFTWIHSSRFNKGPLTGEHLAGFLTGVNENRWTLKRIPPVSLCQVFLPDAILSL